MALRLRQTLLQNMLYQPNKFGGPALVAMNRQRKAAMSHVTQPPEAKCYENNVVVSPYSDCKLYDMTLTQRFFESAVRWPDKIIMVAMSS